MVAVGVSDKGPIRPIMIKFFKMTVTCFKPRVSALLKVLVLLVSIFGLHQNTLYALERAPKGSETGLTIYVSLQGNDLWSGKLRRPNRNKSDGPFGTLERARDEIRTMKAQGALPPGNIIVEIQEGLYELPAAFELSAEDGGADADSRIIYRGRSGKAVRLSAGKQVVTWDLVIDDAILGKLGADVRGKVYQADLAALGVTDYGSPEGKGIELFFNDQPMWISRYPNKNFVKITGLFDEEPVDVRGTKGDKVGKFSYDDARINRWKDEKDAWVSGYWFWDWAEQRHKVAHIDSAQQVLEVMSPYHNFGYRLGQWFFGFNLLSEIDEPGEYYVDRETGILYFYPPSDINKGNAFISMNKNVVNLSEVSFLTIQNVIMEGSRESVVEMQDCVSATLVGSIIRNAGDEGVIINGGRENGVVGCDLYGLGAGGIKINAGNLMTLDPANCYAENNSIHHVARIKRVYFPGISLNGVGNRASHNLIRHLPHMGIYFNGNDHLIEYNEIYDVCYESNDAGAIYAGRSWVMRGNTIRHNYLHDISGFEGKGSVGVYLDDAFCGVDVIGNIFDNVTRAMMIGGGRDNRVLNNIFINCAPTLHVDARSLGWMYAHADRWIAEEKETGNVAGIAYNKPPYSTRYPELVNLMADEPKAPKGNVIARNISQGGTWDKSVGFWRTSIETKARAYISMSDNVVAPGTSVEDSTSTSFIVTKPLFVNPENPKKGAYQLRANSPALQRGFEQIPFKKIGLYKSRSRASWPVKK